MARTMTYNQACMKLHTMFGAKLADVKVSTNEKGFELATFIHCNGKTIATYDEGTGVLTMPWEPEARGMTNGQHWSHNEPETMPLW